MIEMSHSQFEQRKNCRKAWAFSKVDRLIGIPSIAALRGNRYHEALEQNIVSRDFSHDNEHIMFGLDYVVSLEDDRTKVVPEVYVEKIESDVKVRGYIDVTANSADGVELVADWKFPGRDPGRVPKTGYVRQLQLYAFLSGATKCAIVYPQYKKKFEFDADYKKGEMYFGEIVEEGIAILEDGSLDRSGFEVKGKPSPLCNYCDFRDICSDRRK